MSENLPAPRWMIYGANGYTGRLAARRAQSQGKSPILAGRSRQALDALGGELGLEVRIFGLEDPALVAKQLQDVDVVLHCAGPFSATSAPMLEGCVRAKTHYLDITGEIDVFEFTQQHSSRWREAGIMVIPGVGFDVVPSDCLAAMLSKRLPGATRLRMAFKSKNGKLSPGTTKTMIEGLPKGGMIRRNGRLTTMPAAHHVETIRFEDGEQLCVAIPWGDVSTAFYSTGIPNIEIYIGSTPDQIRQMKMMRWIGPLIGIGPLQSLLKSQVAKRVKGPTDQDRASDEMQLWGEVRDDAGHSATLRMRTPEGYTLTVDSSLAAVERVLAGPVMPGAQTPSRAFGAEFVLSLPGVHLYDSPPSAA